MLIVLKPAVDRLRLGRYARDAGHRVVLRVVVGAGEDHRAHRQHAVDGVLDDLHAVDRRDDAGAAELAADPFTRTSCIIVGVAFTGAIGQWGITEAFKHAPAASVAPLEYSGLAWVIMIDLFVWSAIPSWRTLAGAAVIIGSGLYLLRFESRRA